MLAALSSVGTGVIKFWGPHENGDPGSPFSLRFWGPFHKFGDPQHKSMFTVDTRRFSGPCHEFLDVNIAHNATGSQWLASYSVAIVDLAILKKFTQLHSLQ